MTDICTILLIVIFKALERYIGTTINESDHSQLKQFVRRKSRESVNLFYKYCIGPHVLAWMIRVVIH